MATDIAEHSGLRREPGRFDTIFFLISAMVVVGGRRGARPRRTW